METIVTERSNGSRRVQIKTDEESKVEQSHRKECNINTIVAKAHKTGLFPQRTDRPKYGDFAGAIDYHEANNRILKAQEDFMGLPSGIRNKFDNDPGKLIAFINDPDNASEAEDLGLIPRDETKEIVKPPASAEAEKVAEDVAGQTE